VPARPRAPQRLRGVGRPEDWRAIRLGQVHRTHGEVIAVRGERDRAALLPLPRTDYQVSDRHLRKVGKDCLVSFGASLYSVPAALVTAGMLVELRVTPTRVDIHATGPDPRRLASHPRAQARGEHQIDPAHWHGLPDGHTRATTTDPAEAPPPGPLAEPADLAALLTRRDHYATPVARRDLATYQAAAQGDPADARHRDAVVLPFPTDRRHP
jgi:hypothetical protein